MASGGYLFWDRKPFGGEFKVGSRVITFRPEQGSWSYDDATPSGPALIPTEAPGVEIAQSYTLGGQWPMDMAPQIITFSAWMDDEEDYYALEAAKKKQFIQACLGLYYVDVFSIGAMYGGQTAFKTSRPLAWNGSTVTTTSSAAKALLDGVSQTIVYSGTPGSGEVKLPSSSAASTTIPTDTLTVPSGITGTWLELHYPARPFCLITSIRKQVQTTNGLFVNITVREHLSSTATGA